MWFFVQPAAHVSTHHMRTDTHMYAAAATRASVKIVRSARIWYNKKGCMRGDVMHMLYFIRHYAVVESHHESHRHV